MNTAIEKENSSMMKRCAIYFFLSIGASSFSHSSAWRRNQGGKCKSDRLFLQVLIIIFGRRVVFLKNKHLFCIVLHIFYYDRYYHFLLNQSITITKSVNNPTGWGISRYGRIALPCLFGETRQLNTSTMVVEEEENLQDYTTFWRYSFLHSLV